MNFSAVGWMVKQEDGVPARSDPRSAAMLKLRKEGKTFQEIGELYDISGVRVLQILQEAGSARGARARRQPLAEGLPAAVESFAEAHRGVIEALAASGTTRSEMVERFRLFIPEIEVAVIAQGITASGAIFDADERVLNFSPVVIEGAVWYALAVSLNLDCDRLAALRVADIREAREIGEILHAAGLNASTIAQVLCRVASARAFAGAHPDASLTRKQYDSLRLKIINQLGFQSAKGAAWWPPTGLTVMKRLGDGYWADALSAIGLSASSKGRPRGLVRFDPQEYHDAITGYLQFVAATGHPLSQAGYQEWVEGEQRAGRHRPSSAAVRLRHGTFTAALRAVTSRTLLGSQSHGGARTGAPLSIRALHDAKQELNRFLTELGSAHTTAASALVERFTKSYMQQFEYKRREWLRAMIHNDDGVVARRVADPLTPGKIRDRLSRTPPELAAVLSDMYLDKTGSGDPRRTDGWLRPDAQAELNAIPDKTVYLYSALKEVRNYLTHNSEESRARLSAAIRELAAGDPRFELKQSITNRVVVDWLRAKGALRLRLLCSGVVDLWRAMVVSENILAEPQQPMAQAGLEIASADPDLPVSLEACQYRSRLAQGVPGYGLIHTLCCRLACSDSGSLRFLSSVSCDS